MSRTLRRKKYKRKGTCNEKNCKYCVLRVIEYKLKRLEVKIHEALSE